MARAREIPDLWPTDPLRFAAAKVLTVRSQELFDHSENVLSTDDIERVHDMRVASRRLRAVLEIFAPCFPRKAHRRALRDVKRLADVLGERRDPDVHIAELRRFAAGAARPYRAGVDSLIGRLREEQAAANERLADALAEVAQDDLHARLVALAEAARR